jgi:2-phosphosulfolactate phosphatase
VYPYRWRDDSAVGYAESLGALLASPSRRVESGFSLSPASLIGIPQDVRLVLPSPNGSTLTLATGAVPTFAGCLRNARAVAQAAARVGPRVSVIPAGERWHDATLRPALEDLLGAGAIIRHLPGTRSPEAEHAEHIYLRYEAELLDRLQRCSSGRELIEKGFPEDVLIAGQLNVSGCAPLLTEAAYVRAGR